MISSPDYEIFRYNAKLLTPKEYAALYGITEKKVGKLLDKGLFFSIKYIDDQPRKGIRASIKPKRKRGLLYKMSAESE